MSKLSPREETEGHIYEALRINGSFKDLLRQALEALFAGEAADSVLRRARGALGGNIDENEDIDALFHVIDEAGKINDELRKKLREAKELIRR
jgi:hypothetical protein